MEAREQLAARLAGPEDTIKNCPFKYTKDIEALQLREPPFWHVLLTCRHIGIHRPDERYCNWTARILTKDKRYLQKCLGSALDLGRGMISYDEAIRRAFEWFDTGEIRALANEPKPVGRTQTLNFCPLGKIYTVGHALADYVDWTRIARSPGGHYNNLTMINHHIASSLVHIPLEEFTARDLKMLALKVIETPPRYGFSPYKPRMPAVDLSPDELRKRKRTFNSLVTILRMAFQYAWDSGHITSERPWRCLKRIPVNHCPRTIFLTRIECLRLLQCCTPALKRLTMAALYTGCRVGELANICVEDVGHQVFGIRVAAFKRGPARFVFLPDEGMAFFLGQCDGKSNRDRVLLSDKGKVWKRQHTNLFRRAIKQAGLPPEFVFHGLRHTYASDLVRQGVPLDIVARQLGHAGIRTVSDTYGHLTEQFREEQIRTKFTPLSTDQQQEALLRRNQLDGIWHSVQTNDWRTYGAGSLPPGGAPSRSYVRTDAEVLRLFSR